MLIDDEVKDFVVIIFGKYLKPTTEKLYYKLNRQQNLGKYFQPLYIFATKIAKAERNNDKKIFPKRLKDIKYSIKARDIHKIEQNISLVLVLLVMKKRKNIQSMYQKMF